MNIDKISGMSLKVYASIVLVGALMHGLWCFFIPGYPEMKDLTAIQSGFVFLLNLSVGILLFFFSVMAYWFSSKSFSIKQRKTFAIIMSVLWFCRFILEVLFSVQIPLVFIPNPSLLIKMLGIGLILILLSPWLSPRINEA